MRIAVIINSSAGTNKSGDEYALIKAAFTRKNIEAVLYEIHHENIKKIAETAVESGFDIIAAAGGDGTINAALNVVVDSNLPFGIIPMGTLNHFAKDAGIPLEIEEAVNNIVDKFVVKTDIGEVNGYYFLNNSSVGIYPKMVKHRDKEMDDLGYGKWYAMFRALINVFRKYPLITLRIRTENHYTEIKTPFIFIGNNRYKFDLFNFGIRERINEGILSLYYPKTSGKFSIIRFAFLALINRLNATEDFYNTECREIRINSRREILEVSADGEVLHLNTPLEYRVHPGRLHLIVPENR
jgi:diacylglycerol kinase family enzyme